MENSLRTYAKEKLRCGLTVGMTFKAVFLILAVATLVSAPSQAASVSLKGVPAKQLYLALKDVYELPSRFYSIRKEATEVYCVFYVRGLRYNFHHDCSIADRLAPEKIELRDVIYHDSPRSNIDQGAEILYNAMAGASIASEGGNPPPQSKRAHVNCDVRSPITRPELEDAESFSCLLNDLR